MRLIKECQRVLVQRQSQYNVFTPPWTNHSKLICQQLGHGRLRKIQISANKNSTVSDTYEITPPLPIRVALVSTSK